jgi:hypothetical protein
MISKGYEFAIIRGYHSYGAIDLNATDNLNIAYKSGLLTDVYMFPCNGKKTPE